MATISAWNPFGVSLNIAATAATVTRTSATQYTVKFNVSWEVKYSGNKTNYGMSTTSGGNTTVISAFGTSRASGSSTLTGTYSISENGAATKSVTVTFKNYEEDWQGNVTNSATKNVTVSVTVPAWTSYKVTYNANGGSGAPSAQTKWKNQTLKLSSTKPTRTGYTFAGWATSASGSVAYAAGANYTANTAVTLYAKWTALTYTVKYDANGGSGAPANQTKTYGQTLTLSSTKPTRTNYTFKGWGTSSSDTTVSYSAGGSYTTNAAITLYAIWELSYTKPRITGLSVLRCDSGGTALNNGTYALVSFSWASDKTISSIAVNWSSSAGSGSADVAASGTSGTVSVVVGNGALDVNTTYSMEVIVTDSVDSTTAKRTLNSLEALIQGLAAYAGLAFGKAAELEGCADFGPFKGYFRKNIVCENDLSVIGIDSDGNELSALIPVSQSGNTSLGYGLYKAQKGNTHLYGNKIQFYTNDGIYLNGNKLVQNNDISIVAKDPDGNEMRVFSGQSANGNVVIGYDCYDKNSGNVHLYGSDLIFYIKNSDNPGSYRPYYRKGDSIDITNFRSAGYVTSSSKNVWFVLPLTKPIFGSPAVTVDSINGFILRQNNAYTHGSSGDTWITPASYSVAGYHHLGVVINATFTSTTNVINNAPIGIQWSGTITFS